MYIYIYVWCVYIYMYIWMYLYFNICIYVWIYYYYFYSYMLVGRYALSLFRNEGCFLVMSKGCNGSSSGSARECDVNCKLRQEMPECPVGPRQERYMGSGGWGCGVPVGQQLELGVPRGRWRALLYCYIEIILQHMYNTRKSNPPYEFPWSPQK